MIPPNPSTGEHKIAAANKIPANPINVPPEEFEAMTYHLSPLCNVALGDLACGLVAV
jgi:hypothetical protein